MSKELAKALLKAAANEIDAIATGEEQPWHPTVEYINVRSHTGSKWKNGRTKWYTLTCVNGDAVACTCEDFIYRKCNPEGTPPIHSAPHPCKHMDRFNGDV